MIKVKRTMIRIRTGETGASLVELLVAIAIAVMVTSFLSTALVQFILTTRWGNHQLQVTNDIQVASLYLGRDALEAAGFTPGTSPVYGTLSWADDSQEFRYSYNAADQQLIREYYLSGALQSTTTVARHISNQADVVFTLTGKLLSVSITSTSGDESETADLEFALRTR
ncbi:MAG: hypothetical protein P8Y34_06175 [Anaerolineales bacterium]